MKHDASVLQGHFIDDGEMPGEGLAEGGLGDVLVDGLAATDELVELGVGGGDPFEDEVACGEGAAEVRDAVHWDLAAEQEMVQYGEHHHRVEVTGAAAEEGGVFAVFPTG